MQRTDEGGASTEVNHMSPATSEAQLYPGLQPHHHLHAEVSHQDFEINIKSNLIF